MPYGYSGRILHVDLSKAALTVEEPTEVFYRTYFGGQAMGLYYILKQMPRGSDALGPDNVLAVTLSVLTGAPVSGQSRVNANAKSPLTGAIGDSSAGGFWPAAAKAAGFDGFIIKGKSETPVYLWVHDGQAELRDAGHLWGLVTGEAEAGIREELDDAKIEVMQIGPAGENLVRYACIMNMCNRAMGRTGMGAVMGSKNLKAIAVRGKQRLPVADPTSLRRIASWGAKSIPDSMMAGLHLSGTVGGTASKSAGEAGLPTRNWSSGVFEGAEALGSDDFVVDRDTCYACALRCKRRVGIVKGPFNVDPLYGAPEYETVAALGSYCGISDLAAVSRANQICCMYGMDTISTGATIAWAMDCFERGILTPEDTGGIDLRFGNAEAMVQMAELIATRDGFGNALADGLVEAARRIGPKAEELAVAVKGNPLPAHMPEIRKSLALNYAVNPYGADHQSCESGGGMTRPSERLTALGLLDPQPMNVLNPEKIRITLYTQWFSSMISSLNLCSFVWNSLWSLYPSNYLVDMVRAVTGWNVSLWELMKVGQRSHNMMRAFNAREGFTSAEDRLPSKVFEPLVGGKTEGLAVTEEEMSAALPAYYAMNGWDAEGRPTRANLDELGIGWVADELAL